MGEKPGKTMVERLGVPTMVALWYLCSIVGNNAGKEVLPLFPYPFTLSLLQFFMGASSVPLYLAARGRPVGHLVLLVRHFLKRALLLGVTGIGSNLLHRVALLYITVSFEHTVKATQPLWSAALSAVLLRQRFSRRTVLALLVITVGVALSAVNEFQFHWLGFFAAMGSAFSMSVANTYQKRFMVKAHASSCDLGASATALASARQHGSSAPSAAKFSANDLFFVTNACSFALMAPLWWHFDGWRLFGRGGSGAEAVRLLAGAGGSSSVGDPPLKVVVLVALNTAPMVLQHFVSISLLARVSPVTHSIVNSGKRLVVIALSVAYFRNPVSRLNACGMLLAVAGVLLYNRALGADKETFAESPASSPVARGRARKKLLLGGNGAAAAAAGAAGAGPDWGSVGGGGGEEEACDVELGRATQVAHAEVEEAYAGTEDGSSPLHSSSSTAHHRPPPSGSSVAKGP